MLMLLAPLLVHASLAQDTVDLGVLKHSEIKVVQKVLYNKASRLEVGAALGVMPFDGYTIAPVVNLRGAYHLSETIGAEVALGGGYGLKTARYIELEGQSYGVAVEAYRYLGSVEADVQWTPIYAKLNLAGKGILHHDVYALLGVGATIEQSVLPSADITVSPGAPIGIGTRIYLSKAAMLRAELRDNVMYEYRAQSQTGGIKQNVGVTVGVSLLLGQGK